jgi:transcriptional regulator
MFRNAQVLAGQTSDAILSRLPQRLKPLIAGSYGTAEAVPLRNIFVTEATLSIADTFRYGGIMYIPKANEETRTPVLHQLIRSQPFASLITFGKSGLFASHIPMLLEVRKEDEVREDEQAAALGLLKGHLSRANAQWKDFAPDVEALAIFSGPQHYITPTWYEEKQATGKVVPTWNYVVVHAYGSLKIIEDAAWLRAHVESLTNIHEAGLHEATRTEPWKVSDAPASYIDSMLKGIVGLEFRINRLEGKWKLSQNRSESDRRGVAEGLDALDTSSSQSMKQLILDTLPK